MAGMCLGKGWVDDDPCPARPSEARRFLAAGFDRLRPLEQPGEKTGEEEEDRADEEEEEEEEEDEDEGGKEEEDPGGRGGGRGG
eukprot:7067592-Pyramimonas_sp.AAC.1